MDVNLKAIYIKIYLSKAEEAIIEIRNCEQFYQARSERVRYQPLTDPSIYS